MPRPWTLSGCLQHPRSSGQARGPETSGVGGEGRVHQEACGPCSLPLRTSPQPYLLQSVLPGANASATEDRSSVQ